MKAEHGVDAYEPHQDEPYMNPNQLAWFKARLEEWRDSIHEDIRNTLDDLREGGDRDVGDDADRAEQEALQALELRTQDRERKLLRKIDEALARIADGSYGWCEDTGEPIGVERLKARPVATLSVDAQEERERRQMLGSL